MDFSSRDAAAAAAATWSFLFLHPRAGAVAKYCDEHVCLSVCLSACVSVSLTVRIAPEPHARSLAILAYMLLMAVARSCGRVTKSQGDGAVLGPFFHIDSAL